MATQNNLKIVYLVHDLSDAGVAKRIAMLKAGGTLVSLAGFRRTAQSIESAAFDFGQTYNGGFIQRAWSVLKQVFFIEQHKALFTDTDIIIARNLEMLAIAVRGRSLCSKKPTIIYECLDIHRLLLGSGPLSTGLRALETWLLKRASAIITSSPAFISEYFKGILPIKLIENKVYPAPAIPTHHSPRTAGPPWKIGWFGMIRCRESLAILTELVKKSEGKVEVIIRGRPSLDQFDDFNKLTGSTPGLQFLVWAIDKFEDGLNSSWLLPNRLYEGGLFAAVPIALKDVETGRTIERLGIGRSIPTLSAESLHYYFNLLTAEKYHSMEQKVSALPPSTWSFSDQDCAELVAWLGTIHGA